MDMREEMEVVAEAMGIHPTSYTPKTDSRANNTPTVIEKGWFEG